MADPSRTESADGREDTRRAVLEQLAPLSAFLARPNVIEVVVNGPGEVWVETYAGWETHAAPEVTYVRLERLAKATATYAAQVFREDWPILSATLPDSARIQIVGPPAVASGLISVTIRKPSTRMLTLGDLSDTGLFESTSVGPRAGPAHDVDLAERLVAGDVAAFLAAAVRAKKNIIISGATGSGKTTLSKALIQEIPTQERIITIEDTPELVVPQANRVALYYAKGGHGRAKVGPKDLLESALRMRPDRILLQELRDGTAFHYLRNVNSGHPGSITTVHADSCALAFEQLTLLVKESDGGASLARDDIRALLHALVDVVVQCKRVNGTFRVTEVALLRNDGGNRKSRVSRF